MGAFLADPGARAPRRRPRWAFSKGAAIGFVAGIPMLGVGVWLLARQGLGREGIGLLPSIRSAALFAGAALVITAGGVGRLAAYASVEVPGGRRRAAWVAIRAFAAAGAGLVLIALIPNGRLPYEPWGWAAAAAVGALVSIPTGALIGLACGGPTPLSLPELVAMARWPAEALRDLLPHAPPPPDAPKPPGGRDEPR